MPCTGLTPRYPLHGCLRIALLFTLLIPTLLPAEITVSMQLADTSQQQTVYLGDSFQLNVVVSGAQNALDQASVDGLDDFSINSVGHHSNVSIVNSAITAEKTTAYTLFPKKTGTFRIGPARVKHLGKTYESQTLTLHVLSQNALTQENKSKLTTNNLVSNKSGQAPDIFCRWETNKKSVVIGESIPLKLKIYITDNVTAVNNLQIKQIALPEFNACSMKKNSDDFKQYKQTINNQAYTIHEKEFVLFPAKAGTLQINPAQVVYVKQRKQRRSFGFFDEDFFSAFGVGQQKAVVSNDLTISVKPLPNYYDTVAGVGTFQSFRATIDKNNVLINEPIKLTLTIEGEGDFDLIAAPQLALPENFKSYDSKTSKNQTHGDSLTRETKSFEYILQVPSAGEQTIPSQKFVYFDIASKAYKTVLTDSIPITVTTPVGARSYAATPETLPPDPEPEVKPLTKTIHFIQEDIPATKKTSRALSLWFFIILILLVPLLFFLKKVNNLLFIPLLSRFSSEQKNLLPLYQSKLALLIKKEKLQDFYAFFINFLSQISGKPKQNIDQDWIAYYLLSCGTTQEDVDEFLEHLNQCAIFSFGSSALRSKQVEQDDLKSFYEISKRWLEIINKYAKNT